MGQRLRRIVQRLERPAQVLDRRPALGLHHVGAQHGGQHHDRQRGPEPDQTADLDEKRDLDERDQKEGQKQPHVATPFAAGVVDSTRCLTYIGKQRKECHDTPKFEVPMNSPVLQLLVLAGIAVFLILRLRSVLGTREGYEKPPAPKGQGQQAPARRDFEVIEGGPDHDIIDHVPENSESAKALAEMKRVEPSFSVSEFLSGARGAYEWILMGFERGEMDELRPFLDDDVYESFAAVVEQREQQGLTIEAEFVGVREMALNEASFDPDTRKAELTVRFVGELTSVVKNAQGEVVEGSATAVKRQKDVWTFSREMGSDDPNWQLVATDA